MKPATTQALRKLKDAAWFSKGGTLTAADEDDAMVPVASLGEALEISFSKDAAQVCEDMVVTLSRAVSDKYGSGLWENRSDELGRRVDRLVDSKLANSPVLEDHLDKDELPRFAVVLKGDLSSILLATEFKELVTTKIYEFQLHWYLAGHFPCGWVKARRRFFVQRVGKLGVW